MHHDTHDVFVLQVAGEKRWLVYEPVLELPLKDQRYSPELGGPGEVVHDVVLRAGDTMYLPRGWLHQAMTSDVDSLHLTVGVNLYTWIEALRAALKACENEVELRRSVPADGEGGPDLAALLAERLEPEAVVRRMRRRFIDARRPILDDRIAELRALDELTVDSEVVRRPTVIFDMRTRGDGSVRLAFEGKRVVLPAHAREEVEQLAVADEPVRLRRPSGRARRGEPARAGAPARARGLSPPGLAREDAVRRGDAVERTLGRRRLAREEPRLVREPLDDVHLVDGAGRSRRGSGRVQPSPERSAPAKARSSMPASPAASRTARSAACTVNE